VGELSRVACATNDILHTLQDLHLAAPYEIPTWVLEFEPPLIGGISA
jgi:hypothetical protein